MLEAVPQLDEREDLTGHVAVLAPPADLVVVELGVRVPERRRLRVLVDVALPALRRDRTERAAAVDQRDRAADPAGDLARGVRRAFDLGRARVAAATASCSCASTSSACASGSRPMQNSVHEDGARPARRARHAACSRRGTGCASPRRRAPRSRAAPRRPTDDQRARRRRSTPAAIDSVSSVPPEYDSANTSVRGPTNAGVRYCLSTVTGTGSVAVRDRREHVARDPRPAHAEHDDVVDRRRPAGRSDGPTSRPRPRARRRELLRQARDRVEETRGNRRWRHGRSRLERRADAVGLGLREQALVLGVARRSRPRRPA